MTEGDRMVTEGDRMVTEGDRMVTLLCAGVKAVTLLSPSVTLRQGANVLYIGVLTP